MQLTVRQMFSVALVMAGATAVAEGRMPTRFPGEQSHVRAPGGAFVVENVDSDESPHHVLYLRKVATGERRKLIEYERHVKVLWSPTAEFVAIADFEGSDSSRCLVFSVDASKPMIDVSEALRRELPSERRWTGNHHVYFEPHRWIDERTLEVRVSGYGDLSPSGFVVRHRYRIP